MEDTSRRGADRESLLVTGVDGVVGANLAVSLADRFRAVGLFRRWAVSLPRCATLGRAPASEAEWKALIGRQRPRWIIHCGSLAQSSWDLPQTAPAEAGEAQTCATLAEASAEAGSRLTILSSDAVFAGPRLFHDERTPANGRQPWVHEARQAEDRLVAAGALVVRTHAYGWTPGVTPPGFAERVWQVLVEGGSAGFDPNRHATPILASDLAELLWLAYRRGLQGLYHIAGAERTSAYRFAVELAAAFGLTGSPFNGDGDPLDHVQADHLNETSLSTTRARRELGRPMPMLREGLDRFAEQAANGYRGRLQCGIPATAMLADAA